MATSSVTSRLNELLEALRTELDTFLKQNLQGDIHPDDYGYKLVTSQIQEIHRIKKAIMELEMQHVKIKEGYEEEISQLKNELQKRRRDSTPAANAKTASTPSQSSQPSFTMASTNTRSNIMNSPMAGNGMPGSQMPNHAKLSANAQSNTLPSISANRRMSQNAESSVLAPIQSVQPKEGPPAQLYSQNAFSQAPPAPESQIPMGSSSAYVNNAAGSENTTKSSTPSLSQPGQETSLNNGSAEQNAVVKKEETDWSVTYAQGVTPSIAINLLHTLEHTSVICCVKFSHDGKLLATGCNRAALVFSVETGQLLTHLQEESSEKEGDLYVRSVAFSADGKYLATGVEDRQIRIWDIAQKRVHRLLSGHEQEIYSLDYSRDGKYLVSGSGDRTVYLWSVETGQRKLVLHTDDGITTVAFSPDSQYIAAGSLDKVIRIWSINGTLLEQLVGHQESVYSVAFSPDGLTLASGSLDNTIKLWELQSAAGVPTNAIKPGGICKKTFTGHKNYILSVALSPDGKWIVSGSKDRTVQFWNPNGFQSQATLQGHNNSVISVAMSPTGNCFATGSGDLRARIWSYQDL
ncbi:transcriptional corepressor Tup12 [Schizosaccharomyces japonicus yFS275]|uniref:Transcriptional corepressor Tup12 n=2 Tax=Schizosaccharomyces japonicus TaxID=4897 RepID=B6K845_SCHJY|nr:transcriptional corepressor Tup12 [Schizosaccharomyces japonicus yFS275]ACZ97556.1 Tup12 protein [Schizosaccharomyces japonicus]EEB09699.1 transcriptional corepressor Tup12 [Schizosaccharomyces japonicus yFS275]